MSLPKPKHWAALLLLLAAAWVLRDALSSGGRLVPGAPYTDLSAQFLSWRQYGFSELRAGRLALWNPYLFCGIPFLGGFESALLYPPNWIHLFLPVGLAVDLTVLFHLFLAGWGTYAWLRSRGRAVHASLAGAALFMFSGPVYLRVYAGHLPVLCALAWAPVLFYSVEKRAFALGAAAVAMQVLAGNPQYAYFTALAVGAYALLNGGGARLRLMYAGGLLLSAAQWLPGLATMSESVRAVASYDFASQFALPVENVITVVFPHFFGGPGAYGGRSLYWEGSVAFGALGALLALAAAYKPAKRDRPLLWLGAGALLLAVGPATPFYALAYWTVPGISALRGIGKLSFVFTLCLCALAASGLERVSKKARLGEPWTWALAALVLLQSLHFANADRAATDVARPYPGEWRDALSRLAPGERALHDFTRFPNMGLDLRVGDLWGYSALVPRRYAELMAAAQGKPWEHATQYLLWKKDAPAILDLLRCRAVLPELPGGAITWGRSPMKRAQIVWSWSTAPSAAAALRELTAPRFDPRARVVLEEDPGLGPAPSVGGRAPVVDEAADADGVGLALAVETARPSILLITDSYSSGWRAWPLPGSAQTAYRVIPADHALIGIPLSPGRHRLHLVYRPAAFVAGAWLSLLGAAGFALFLVL